MSVDRGAAAQMGNRRRLRRPSGGQLVTMTAIRNGLLELGFGEHPVDGTLVYGAQFSPGGQLPPLQRVVVDVYHSDMVPWIVYVQTVWLTTDARMGTRTATLEARTPTDSQQAIERATLAIVEVIRDVAAGRGVALKIGS